MQDVELQDDERRLAPVGGDVDQVVAVGLERRFADDVEVGDDVALRRDEEARADRGLAGAALQDGADLDQLRARLLVDLARRQRHRRGGHGRRRRAGGRGGGRIAARRRAQLRRRGRCGQRQHAQGRPAPDANSHPRRFYGPTPLPARRERRCYSRPAASARTEKSDWRHCLMQRRRLIRAALAGTAAFALPAIGRAQAVEKPKLTIAVGGKNLLYYLPLTVAEVRGYLKDEGLDVTIADFAGGSRALQALVGGSADVVSGAFEHTINMQVKGQRLRAFVLQGRAPQIVLGINPKTMPNFKSVAELKGKKLGVTAPGSSTNVLANFVLAKVGAQAGRRLDHRRRRRQRRGRGDALGADRRDLQPRSGDHAARPLGRPEDRLRHARRRRGRPRLRRADAGRLPLHAAELPRQEPADGAGARQRDRPRRQVDPGRGPGRDHQGGARELPARRPRRLHRRLPRRQGRALARRHVPRGGPGDGAARARQHRPEIADAKIDLAAIYTNDYVKRANAKYPKG